MADKIEKPKDHRGRIDTTIAYVHSTTKNITLDRENSRTNSAFEGYKKKFETYYNKLLKEKEKITNVKDYEEKISNLIKGTGEWLPGAIDKFKDGLQYFNKYDFDNPKNWTVKSKSNNILIAEQVYGGHEETIKTKLNYIIDLIQYFNDLFNDGEASIKQIAEAAGSKYVLAYQNLLKFFTENSKLINALAEYKDKEIVIDLDFINLIKNWNTISQKISIDLGFLAEVVLTSNIFKARGEEFSEEIAKNYMMGKDTSPTDIVIGVGGQELRIQLKTSRYTSMGIITNRNNQSEYTKGIFAYHNTKKISTEQMIKLCNIYNLCFNPLPGSIQYSKDLFYKYLLNIVFQAAFDVVPKKELPNLIMTPMGYYFYSDLLKDHWLLLLNNSDPKEIVEYYIKQEYSIPETLFLNVNNDSMYKEKRKLTDKVLAGKFGKPNKWSKKIKNTTDFKKTYISTGKYGKKWASFIAEERSLNYAIWDLAYQLVDNDYNYKL